jgi:hypothetical protein
MLDQIGITDNLDKMNVQADLDLTLDSGVVGSLVFATRPNRGEATGMDSTQVLDRLDSLIDDLLNQSDLPASSLASMLMAARDSVKDGYHVALARRVWDVSHSVRDQYSSGFGSARHSVGSLGPE